MNSGLRQPQNYAANNSRLPLPDTMPSSSNNNRGRRQSVVGTFSKSPQLSNTLPHHDRPIRSRTMSDAPRPDFQQQQRAPFKDRRLELRRSLYLDHLQQQQEHESDSDSENESTTKNRKYRSSAPLLDAYGVPLSPAKQARALSSIQNGSTTNTSRFTDQHHQQQLPPSDLNQKIRVCVRKRPLSRKEVDKGDKDMAPSTGNRGLQINEPKYVVIK